jgi:hypothetical protein
LFCPENFPDVHGSLSETSLKITNTFCGLNDCGK